MRIATFKKGDKEYEYKYVNHLDLFSQFKAQKMMMGGSYYKRYNMSKKAGRIEFEKILRHITKKMTNDIVMGYKVDLVNYEIEMIKQRTDKKTPTVFNNHLYIPVIRHKTRGKRIRKSMHDILPTVDMQIKIRKAFQNNKYENI